MSFPWQHQPWRETAEFVAAVVGAEDRILAPDQFWSIVTRVERFVPANLVPGPTYDFVVLNTDDMEQIPRSFLEDVAGGMTPVFANRQFVVWSAHDSVDDPDEPDRDLRHALSAFWTRLASLGPEPSEPNRCVQDLALADAPRITRLSEVDDSELRATMNDLFGHTGYRYPTLRDQRYREEICDHLSAFLAREPGPVLDLATGSMAFAEAGEMTVVRTDLAEVGVCLAREADRARPNLLYATVDAGHLAFPDATFGAVVLTDAIEHVRDASRVLHEIRRVLRPGGGLLVTFANRNSVNQVLTEKLGHPRFLTNHQHIREFALDEIRELLGHAGLEVESTAGVSLYPYWGVPGVDETVREITDGDPEFVALMSELGRRVGAAYAYTGVVRARRSAS